MTFRSEETTEVIAYFFAVRRRSEAEIAKLMQVSKATVWRHLQIATGAHKKIKLTKPLLKSSAPILVVSESDRERIRIAAEEKERPVDRFSNLFARLKATLPYTGGGPHPLKGVWVFPLKKGSGPPQDSVAFDNATEIFARAVGPCVAELLRSARYLGVSWGRTLQRVTESLVALNLAPRRRNGRAVVFPINGDFQADITKDMGNVFEVFPTQTRLSPSFLAAEIATALNGTAEGTPSLISVPAIVPLKWNTSAAEVIKKYISEMTGYASVLGTRATERRRPAQSPEALQGVESAGAGLIDKMDTLLVAVGSSQYPRRGWYQEIVNYIGTSEEKMRTLTHGDIGAVLVPRENLTAAQKVDFERIEGCYTGIRLPDINQCAMRARTSRAAGVIALGIGRSRCRIMIESVRRGFVNHLIIDDELARALENYLDGKGVFGE